MLNSDDHQTVISIRALQRIVASSEKPIVLWVGAGASKWRGYPLWDDLAREMRSDFYRNVLGFDNKVAVRMLETGDLPSLFEMLRRVDSQRYFRYLKSEFKPRPTTPLYEHFVQACRSIGPFYFLTTNIDESLERDLSDLEVVQRSDVERSIDLLVARSPFIAKLHGSVSSIESTVFCTSDYNALTSNRQYLAAIEQIFRIASVLFIGYSARDQYLLELLDSAAGNARIFGSGPHFLVAPAGTTTSPHASVQLVTYDLKRFPDHRSAITVLDVVHQSRSIPIQAELPSTRTELVEKGSSIYISDMFPPGTWQTSQTAKAESPTGIEAEITVGTGLSQDEFPHPISTAVHDLAVGLICFDRIYIPINALGRCFRAVGELVFRELIQEDALRFVHILDEIAFMVYPQEVIGHVGLIRIGGPENPAGRSTAEVIGRQLTIVSGKEAEAHQLIEAVEKVVVKYSAGREINLAGAVRGSLLMPGVSRLLGVGDAIVTSRIPKWLRFPTLRMGEIVAAAAVCDYFSVPAAKLLFGGPTLVTAAFGVVPSEVTAETYATFALTGQFNTDLGRAIITDPQIIRTILRFRRSPEGERFRSEIYQGLDSHGGSEFAQAVNSGLRRTIPAAVLQEAKNKMSSLLTQSQTTQIPTVVWSNRFLSDQSTISWRQRSAKELLALARQRGIRKDDPCLCGSGDKLRLCCLRALHK